MSSLDVIMRQRRLEEPHDWQPIRESKVIVDMMNAWRREWKADNQQNSIFIAYLKRNHGGK